MCDWNASIDAMNVFSSLSLLTSMMDFASPFHVNDGAEFFSSIIGSGCSESLF
jgi:hypothetical protein